MDNITETDNFFGKKAKARRKAARTARKKAKASGLKGKAKRMVVRDARQNVKARQLSAKAQSGKVSKKRATKLTKRSAKIGALDGKSRLGQSLLTVALAPLLPFKRAMIEALKEKGKYQTTMTFPNLVDTFFKEVVKKGNSYEDSIILEDLPINKVPIDEPMSSEDYDNFAAPVAAIVTAIINFFKKKKEERKSKVAQTPSEKKLAIAAEKVEKQLEQKAKDSKPISKETLKRSMSKKKKNAGKILGVTGGILGDIGKAIEQATGTAEDVTPIQVFDEETGEVSTAGYNLKPEGGFIKYLLIAVFLGLLIYMFVKG